MTVPGHDTPACTQRPEVSFGPLACGDRVQRGSGGLPLTLEDLKPGDHVCCIYRTEEEHRAVLTPFLRQGLQQNERVLCITDVDRTTSLLAYLRDTDLDVESFLTHGQLVMLTGNDTYTREGAFDPDAMLALLRSETERALAEGYSALRATEEMAWVLRGLPGSNRLIEYEAKLNEFFPGSKCIALCAYDQRQFTADVLLDVLRTHPVVVMNGKVHKNFYYLPPAQMLGSDIASATLDQWRSQLEDHQRAEEALSEAHDTLKANLLAIPDLMFEVDQTGRVFDYHAPKHELLYVPPEAFLGKTFSEVLPNDAARAIGHGLSEAARVGWHRGTTYSLDMPSGKRWFELSIARKGEIGSDNPRFIALARDITERKQAEEALRESARLLRAILDNIPDPAWLKDHAGRFLAINEAWCRWAGADAEKAIGRTNEDILGSDVCETFNRQDEEVIRSGKPLRWEESFPDGEDGLRWFDTIKAPIFSEQGTAVGTVGIGRETTERKQAEEATQRMAAIIDNSSDFMGVRNLQTGVNYNNPAAFDMLGYDIAEKKTLSIEEAHLPEDVERVKSVGIPEALAKGIWRSDNRLRHRDGHLIPVEQIIFPVRDKEMRVFGVATIMRDVTDRRRAEQEREQLHAQLRQSQKLEAVGLLAGGVAHEFNNLLMVMMGNSDRALRAGARKRKERDAITDDALKEIRLAAERAATLTRQLLTFSRKQEAPRPERIDVRQVIMRLKSMLGHTLGDNIQLKVVRDSNQDCVLADAMQIEQAVLNLAINARDAMPQGGDLTIEVSTVMLDEEYVAHHLGSKPGPHVMIVVSDAGTGMDEHTLTHMFEPFFTTKPVGKGTGLGLAMVYGIVQQAQGHIQVRSAPGEGSTFKLFFPVVQGTAVVKDQVAPNRVGGTETILLCDDNPLVRRTVRRALEEMDYHVLEAENGPDALRLAADHGVPIHLLLTDLAMPGMTGYELAEAMTRQNPALKILFMSGYASGVLDASPLSFGESPFLQKPFMPEELLSHVRHALDS